MIVFLSIDSAKMKRKQTSLTHSWPRKSYKVWPFMSLVGKLCVCSCYCFIDYMHT